MKAREYLEKAYYSIYENDFEGAIHWFECALAVEPDNADIHYRYSITCARSNRLDKAITHARLSSDLMPQHEEYLIHFNRLQSKKLTNTAKKQLEKIHGEKEEVNESLIQMLEEAIELDPLSVEAQVWLAITYAELEEYTLALDAVQAASALPQDEIIARQLLELEQRFKDRSG